MTLKAYPSQSMWRELALLTFIILLGAGLRLTMLDAIPFGLDHDEGHNALDALQIIDGWRPVFLPRNNGREPLFMYLMAWTFATFGPTIWSMRLAGAIASILIMPAQYLLVRSLPLPRPALTALLSVAVSAFTFWPISKGHQALRAGMLPLWICLWLWVWWKALAAETKAAKDSPGGDQQRPSAMVYPSGRLRARLPAVLWAALAGVFIAAAVYTHMTGRLLPLVALASAGWVALRERTWRPFAPALVALLVAGTLALPQALYFWQNPELLTHRANQASIFNPDINEGAFTDDLIDNARALALMFNVRGTTSWSENIAGRPIFDPLVGLAFLLGLTLLLRDLTGRRGKSPQVAAVLLGATFLVMMVPSWLSEKAPHYGRLTGIWPVLFLLPAWGLERSAAWLDRRWKPVGLVAVSGVLAVSAVWSAVDFFVRYDPGQRQAEAFRGINLSRGLQVRDLVAEGPTYLSPNAASQSVTRFLNIGALPGAFDPRRGLALPPDGDSLIVVFEPGELEDAEAFGKRWPQARRDDLYDREGSGQRTLIVFRLPRATWPQAATDFPNAGQAVFGDAVRLTGLSIERQPVAPRQVLPLTLVWEALAPTEQDHNFFVHLVGANGKTLAQFDGAPLGGSFPSHLWTPGERIVQRIELTIPGDAPLGQATLRVGWYNWRDGQRLLVPGDDDAAVEVGLVEIRRQ